MISEASAIKGCEMSIVSWQDWRMLECTGTGLLLVGHSMKNLFLIPVQAPCSSHQFRCNNGQCIDIDRRCDAHFDCIDFTDEFHCGKLGKRDWNGSKGGTISIQPYCDETKRQSGSIHIMVLLIMMLECGIYTHGLYIHIKQSIPVESWMGSLCGLQSATQYKASTWLWIIWKLQHPDASINHKYTCIK